MHPLGVVPEAMVDCWRSAMVFISLDFVILDSFTLVRSGRVEWNFGTGGGTLSGPTGCSPRDHGRLLAVDYGLKNSSSFFLSTADSRLMLGSKVSLFRSTERTESTDPVGAR